LLQVHIRQPKKGQGGQFTVVDLKFDDNTGGTLVHESHQYFDQEYCFEFSSSGRCSTSFCTFAHYPMASILEVLARKAGRGGGWESKMQRRKERSKKTKRSQEHSSEALAALSFSDQLAAYKTQKKGTDV
jgi:hypothetical protein